MNKKQRYKEVLAYFQKHVPIAETELNYKNPYELLVAVILSAQCTDKRVNLVTPKLFNDFPNVESLSHSSPDVIFTYIKSVSYPNNKAKHLCGMAKMLVDDYNQIIPNSIEELVKLPGVGRKTANVILSVVFQKPSMAVDTHVFRLSNRIGLTLNSKNPLQTEKELIKNIPSNLVAIAHHWLILHGRYVCLARQPKCEICQISQYCKYFKSEGKKINLN